MQAHSPPSRAVLLRLARLTGQKAAVDAWTLVHASHVSETVLDEAVDRAVACLDRDQLGEMLCHPDLDPEVVMRLVSRSPRRVHESDGRLPSVLAKMLGERETIPIELWAFVLDRSQFLSEQEITAALARIDVPTHVQEQLVGEIPTLGAALVATISPSSPSAVRAFGVAALNNKGLPAAVLELLKEHADEMTNHPSQSP